MPKYVVPVEFDVDAADPEAAREQVRGELDDAAWYDGWTIGVPEEVGPSGKLDDHA